MNRWYFKRKIIILLSYINYTFVDSISGPPKAPAGCDVHNRTLKSSIVSCSKIRFGGGDQNEKQYFHMEVKDQQSGALLQNQTSSKPIFTIR